MCGNYPCSVGWWLARAGQVLAEEESVQVSSVLLTEWRAGQVLENAARMLVVVLADAGLPASAEGLVLELVEDSRA